MLNFAGAVVAVIRAHRPWHIPFPVVYAAPVAGALVPGFAA
ncbi:hypothetical protein [Streptomyces laculatispora]|nr:hypothetical protein [Streptomyces laculatispora]